MQSNTSKFNPIGLGLKEENHFLLPHSNEIGLARSQLLINNLVTSLHQNEISSQGRPIVGLSQHGLSQRVTDIRRAYGTPHRVQIYSQIDCFPMQNQTTLPLSELSVIEVVRTRFLMETSSRENIFVPNGTLHVQSQPNFQNQSVDNLFTENNPFPSLFSKNLIENRQTLKLGGFFNLSDPKRDCFYQNLTQNHQTLNLRGLANYNVPKRNELLFLEPVSVFAPKANLNPSGNQIPNRNQLGINFQNLRMNKSSNNQMRVSDLANPLKALSSKRVPSLARAPSPVVQNDPNDDYDVEDDGRTHSLPTKQNGPYTCPKCEQVFYTSQCFAAHIGSHYKNESQIERKKRQAARYKKKYHRLFKSCNELTIVPPSFKIAVRRNTYGTGKIAVNIKEKKVLKQEHIVLGMATKSDLPYVSMKIKEELK